jgi:biotin synthase
MIGIGPFIPHLDRARESSAWDIDLTLRAVAVTRIVCKRVYIPLPLFGVLSRDAR